MEQQDPEFPSFNRRTKITLTDELSMQLTRTLAEKIFHR